jgi:CheY-like chemotaxis protein
MPRKVMVVDDDRDMLLSLKEGFEKYQDLFTVLMAGDGMIAVEKLKENAISIVITKLKLPRMDGMQLLDYLSKQCPDIPVIIMGDYGSENSEILAREKGAAHYIEKPFLAEELAEVVIDVFDQTNNGGTLNKMSTAMFLQVVEMEQKTCTIRIDDNVSGKQGILLFDKGDLIDARINTCRGEEAAFDIFSWEDTHISIQTSCPVIEKNIHTDLQAIMLEAMRRKDEDGRNHQTSGAAGTPKRSIESDDQSALNILLGKEEEKNPPQPVEMKPSKPEKTDDPGELELSLDDSLNEVDLQNEPFASAEFQSSGTAL